MTRISGSVRLLSIRSVVPSVRIHTDGTTRRPRFDTPRHSPVRRRTSGTPSIPREGDAMATATQDRELLYGALALQFDFVARPELVAALHQWSSDKSQTIGEILLDRGTLSPHRRGVLEGLARTFLDAYNHDAARALAE